MSLSTLSINHFYRSITAVRRVSGREVQLDSAAARAVMASHVAFITHFDDPEADTLAGAAVSLIASCLTRPLVKGDVITRIHFAIELLSTWLLDLGYCLQLSREAMEELELLAFGIAAERDDPISDVELDQLSALVASPGCISEAPLDDRLRALEGTYSSDPVRVKWAFAVTHASPVELEWARAVSMAGSGVLANIDVLSYLPEYAYQPDLSTEESDSPSWRERNEDQVARCDLVVQIADPPSAGVGVVGEMAQRHRVPRLLIHREGSRISPLLVGVESPPQLLGWDEDDASGLTRTLERLVPVMAAHRLSRIAKAEQRAAELTRLQLAAAELGLDPHRVPDGVDILPVRYARLMSDPYLYGGMTIDEYQELANGGQIPKLPAAIVSHRFADSLPHLTVKEQRIFDTVVADMRLPTEQRIQLEFEGRRIIGRNEGRMVGADGRRRLQSDSRSFWIKVARSLF